jgi:hypothetical protein
VALVGSQEALSRPELQIGSKGESRSQWCHQLTGCALCSNECSDEVADCDARRGSRNRCSVFASGQGTCRSMLLRRDLAPTKLVRLGGCQHGPAAGLADSQQLDHDTAISANPRASGGVCYQRNSTIRAKRSPSINDASCNTIVYCKCVGDGRYTYPSLRPLLSSCAQASSIE